MKVDALIEEMLKVKIEYPSLETADVLRIFNIQAFNDLTKQIKRLVN